MCAYPGGDVSDRRGGPARGRRNSSAGSVVARSVAGVVAGASRGSGSWSSAQTRRSLWHGMLQDGWPFVVLSAVAGVVALAATVRGRERVARIGAAVAVGSVVAGWGVAQWPYLIVPGPHRGRGGGAEVLAAPDRDRAGGGRRARPAVAAAAVPRVQGVANPGADGRAAIRCELVLMARVAGVVVPAVAGARGGGHVGHQRERLARPWTSSRARRRARPRAGPRRPGASGSVTTIGTPVSPPARSAGTSGTCAISGTPRVSAASWPPPVAEDVVALAAVRAHEVGHVLDHADRPQVRALGHLAGALGHLARGLLRRGDDEHRRAREERRQRDATRRRFPAAGRRAGSPGRPSTRRPGTARSPCGAWVRARSPASPRGRRTPSRSPSRRGASSGRIMSLNPTGLPWTPIIRGTLNPQTSASRTPTRCPSAASAQARFTVTLDLPTPPLPDATAMIGGRRSANEILDCCGAAASPPRSCCTSAARCSCDMGERSTSTRSTPSSGCDRRRHVVRDAVLQRTALDRDEHVDADGAALDRDVRAACRCPRSACRSRGPARCGGPRGPGLR